MNLKLIGTFIIITGCGGFGFSIAAAHRRKVSYLRQLLAVLDQVQSELEYRLTPLPELCRLASDSCNGELRKLFINFQAELERQISPDAQCCMNAVLANSDLPQAVKLHLKDFGKTLGKFDLPGQLRGLDAVRKEVLLSMDRLTANQDTRIRSYQTLGLCAGAALAILLL